MGRAEESNEVTYRLAEDLSSVSFRLLYCLVQLTFIVIGPNCIIVDIENVLRT